MDGMPFLRLRCDKCDIKIPKNQPKLRCTICNEVKHLKCQKLTKTEANYILYTKTSWSCRECITSILPVDACSAPANSKQSTAAKFKIKCSVCDGYSYTPGNVRNCFYCENQVHVKCWNESLGCTTCCRDMIPGFHEYTHDIIGDPYLKNNKMYNPYSSTHFTQVIGDVFESAEANGAFNEVSEFLVNCKYKQPTMTQPSTKTELSIFSLNVQTLANKIDNFRENIALYQKYDVPTSFQRNKLCA